MTKEIKAFAEKALNQIFIGSQLDGIKFGIGLVLYFEDYNSNDAKGLWIKIESELSVNQTISNEYINKGLSQEEEMLQLFSLRGKKIVDINLGDISPHLFIKFESGEVLFINGYHEKYESWQAGNGGESYSLEHWLFVATPGNNIAVWSPKK